MTNESLMNDLEHAAQIAREGRDAPLVGGPVGLLWGVLLTVTMGAQYLILERILEVPLWTLAGLWIGFGLIGGIGSSVLGRKANREPGSYSIANRVEHAVWVMFAAAIGAAILGIMAAILWGGQNNSLWGLMVVFGFLGQGIAYGTVTRIKPDPILAFASVAATLAGSVALVFYSTNTVFLIGSIGSFFAIVIPTLLMRKD